MWNRSGQLRHTQTRTNTNTRTFSSSWHKQWHHAIATTFMLTCSTCLCHERPTEGQGIFAGFSEFSFCTCSTEVCGWNASEIACLGEVILVDAVILFTNITADGFWRALVHPDDDDDDCKNSRQNSSVIDSCNIWMYSYSHSQQNLSYAQKLREVEINLLSNSCWNITKIVQIEKQIMQPKVRISYRRAHCRNFWNFCIVPEDSKMRLEISTLRGLQTRHTTYSAAITWNGERNDFESVLQVALHDELCVNCHERPIHMRYLFIQRDAQRRILYVFLRGTWTRWQHGGGSVEWRSRTSARRFFNVSFIFF